MDFFNSCLDVLESIQFAKPLAPAAAKGLVRKYGPQSITYKRKKKTNKYGPKGTPLFYANKLWIEHIKDKIAKTKAKKRKRKLDLGINPKSLKKLDQEESK